MLSSWSSSSCSGGLAGEKIVARALASGAEIRQSGPSFKEMAQSNGFDCEFDGVYYSDEIRISSSNRL